MTATLTPAQDLTTSNRQMANMLHSQPTRPSFAAPTTITAGELDTGDWLIEIPANHGSRAATIKALVVTVAEGPSFVSNWYDRPVCLGRVRVTLADNRSPLLLVGQPVVARKRLT